jgi:hypothetical protein
MPGLLATFRDLLSGMTIVSNGGRVDAEVPRFGADLPLAVDRAPNGTADERDYAGKARMTTYLLNVAAPPG